MDNQKSYVVVQSQIIQIYYTLMAETGSNWSIMELTGLSKALQMVCPISHKLYGEFVLHFDNYYWPGLYLCAMVVLRVLGVQKMVLHAKFSFLNEQLEILRFLQS